MILAIDIGNSTVGLGAVEKTPPGHYALRFTQRLETNRGWGAAEYAAGMEDILRRQNWNPDDFEGAAISSVVPQIVGALQESVRRILGKEALLISAQSDTGLTIGIPEPEGIGQDRLVDAAWAAAHFPLPAVTADLGTAATLNVIREGGVFCGGVIAVGLETGLQALARRAAQLPQIALCTPSRVIGRNTAESMLSGAVAGTAAMLDGVVRDIEEELGKPVTLVITGGTAKYVEPMVRHPHTYDPHLLLKGLAFLYEKNRPR